MHALRRLAEITISPIMLFCLISDCGIFAVLAQLAVCLSDAILGPAMVSGILHPQGMSTAACCAVPSSDLLLEAGKCVLLYTTVQPTK